jgi:hypothetical protein
MLDNTNSIPEKTVCDSNGEDSVLFRTLSRLIRPIVRLCLANGITFATAEEFLKRAFVQEAKAIQPEAPEHGMVSRISTVSGLNRREVTRLTKLATSECITKQPLASEILARWTTDPSWRDQNGAPLVIKRLGAAPSFETLAHSITRDVHPRSLLDELIRLDLVSHDDCLDLITVTRKDFVPQSDSLQMLDFLGNNVGDHLNAAIANVLHDGKSHLEQAVFADELSAESLEVLRPLIMAQWKELHDKMIPTLTSLIEEDKRAGRTQNQRIRIGLYTFTNSTDSQSLQKSQTARRFRKTLSKEVTR